MKIAAAYIRVSTDDQIEYSPASQLDKIQQYAKTHDYVLPEEYIFIDEGISGRNANKRPEFNRMIGVAKGNPKPFDAILLWKFSRFARNREDSVVYKSMLRKQLKIDVVSISEDVGDDKMSVLIEALIEAMDEFYSINLAEEVKRGMTEKASRGEPLTIAPYGYKMVDSALVPDEETAPVVQSIFERFCNGCGMREIAMNLNACGYRTVRGNLFENRTVDYILNNPVYVGKIRWNPTGKTERKFDDENLMIVDGKHSPIVSKELYDKAQKIIAERKIKNAKFARQDPVVNEFMLRGLVRCNTCGSTLTYQKAFNSLQCYKYSHGQCNVSHNINLNKLNNMVIEFIEKSIDSGNYFIVHRDNIKTDINDDTAKQIANIQRKIKRVMEAYESSIYTLDEYKSRRAELDVELQKLKNKCEKKKDKGLSLKSRVKKALPVLKNPTVSEKVKNNLLKEFIDKIIFNRAENSLVFYFYD